MRKLNEVKKYVYYRILKWIMHGINIFLMIWALYEYLILNTFGIPFVLIIGQTILYLGILLFFRMKEE